jgi:hypothetical protein
MEDVDVDEDGLSRDRNEVIFKAEMRNLFEIGRFGGVWSDKEWS